MRSIATGGRGGGLAGFLIAVVVAVPLWSRQAEPVVDRARLLADLRTLSADDMEGRALGTPGNARARAFIVQRFRESGLVPMPAFGDRFEQPLRSGARLPVNVVGLVRGRVVPDRFLVVSAHYDHIGVRGGVVYNGADDNASGTAALFAVARHFTAHPPAHSLIIVAFDGEEAGNLGSQGFVAAPPVPLDALLVDLNADMLARDPRRILFVTGTRLFPAFRPLIEAAARGASVTVRTGHDGVGGEEDWIRDSDQYAFIQAGVPALYLGVEDYAFHHAPTDDADSIMPDFYAGAVEALIGMVGVFDAHGPLLEQVRGETPPRRGGR